jgi:DNA end-binding protein Ku
MGTRASGTAIIQFGLVTIPTKLFVTASSESFGFNMINPETKRKVKQILVDSETPLDDKGNIKEVSRAGTLRGFQYEKDQYVIFNDEELDALDAKQANTIDIAEFTPATAFNPIAVEKSYYLSPAPGAEKPYRLLARALRDEGVVAIGKYYARGRDNLVLVAPRGDSDYLTLYQMYYANEIRNHEYSFSAATEPEDKLLKMAKGMVKKLTTKTFDATQYVDEYAERLRAAIETKRNGGEIAVLPQANAGQAMDLEALLEASMKDDPAPTKVKAKKGAAAAKAASAQADKTDKPADKKASKK